MMKDDLHRCARRKAGAQDVELVAMSDFLIIRRTAERKRKHSLFLEIGLVNAGETFGDDGLDPKKTRFHGSMLTA